MLGRGFAATKRRTVAAPLPVPPSGTMPPAKTPAAEGTAALVTPPGTNTTHYWCATPFTATNRLKLNVLTNTPPFAGNVLVLDYSLTLQPTAPFEFLATNGLAVPTQSIF